MKITLKDNNITLNFYDNIYYPSIIFCRWKLKKLSCIDIVIYIILRILSNEDHH
jgi:hypothetical protein